MTADPLGAAASTLRDVVAAGISPALVDVILRTHFASFVHVFFEIVTG